MGVLLFSDPANWNPQGKDESYPKGWGLPETGIQRGTIIPRQGDALSREYPSKGIELNDFHLSYPEIIWALRSRLFSFFFDQSCFKYIMFMSPNRESLSIMFQGLQCLLSAFVVFRVLLLSWRKISLSYFRPSFL